MEKLSKTLLDKRCQNLLSQDKVSQTIGISKPTYVFLELGKYKRKLTPRVAGKIALYLGVSAQDVQEMFKEDLK